MKTTLLTVAGLMAAALCLAAAPSDEVPGVGEPGGPTHELDGEEMRQWLRGREVFDRDFSAADGVGAPHMNADSCRACHQDPAMGGAGALDVNVSRFGRNFGGAGPFENLPGGQMYSKLQPPPSGVRENAHEDADVFEQRQTPSALGDGLIETIPEAVILANEDPDDDDGDGIRGVARILMVAGQPEVGRFGWKAQVPTLHDFVRDAMGGECGITTPDDGRGFSMLEDGDDVDDPELSLQDAEDIDFFLENLGPPLRGGSTAMEVRQGEALFSALRCDRCHIPTLPGTEGPVNLYSDLLLHNVHKPGFRGMDDPGAPSGWYRTPPLWGIKDTAPYMHDGRAYDLVQAIKQHSGEARFSAVGYEALSDQEQQALIAFLEDL